MTALASAWVLAVLAALAAPPAASAALGSADQARPWVEVLSWKPRAYLWHHFLSEAECDHIIKIATPHIQRSSVVNMDGSITDDPNEVVYAIEHRVANWTHLPVENAEDMQVLKYQNNQTYGAHWDDLDLDENPDGLGGGSVRVATVLIYLSSAEEGGETAFPHSRWLDKEKQTAGVRLSDCAKDGVAALPRKGNAIMFWDTKPGSVRQDKWSMHAGCPVIKGVKWTAVKWIHAKQFGGPYPSRPLATSGAGLERAERLLAAKQAGREAPTSVCRNENSACDSWAADGQCTANAKFMRETCRLACGVCCPEDDVLCERRRQRLAHSI